MWSLTRDPNGAADNRTFPEWKISKPRLRVVSLGIDVFEFDVSLETAADAGPFAYRDEIQIFRTIDGVTVKMFEGVVSDRPLSAPGTKAEIRYRVAGPLYWMRVTYEQVWYSALDPADPASSIVGGYQSHVLLNSGFNGTILNVREQVQDVVSFVNYVAGLHGLTSRLQVGTAPDVEIPLDEQIDIRCMDVLRKQGRWIPSATWQIDYSTTPPTLNVVKRSDQTVVTLPVGSSDPDDPAVDVASLHPREDLRASVVALRYKRVDTNNGASWASTYPDVYPSGVPEQDFEAYTATIDLKGFSYTYETAEVKSSPWYAVSGAPNATQLEWMRRKFSFLRDENLDVNTLRAVLKKVEKEDGTILAWPTSGLLAFEITEGQIPPWASAQVEEYILHFELAYDTRDANNKRQRVRKKPSAVRVTATNLDSSGLSGGVATFSRLSSFEAGDPIPIGLAQVIYEDLSVLQWDGEVIIVRRNIEDDVTIGQKLCLSGGNPEWATMNATVQAIDFEIDSGQTRVKLGFANHLGPVDRLELARANRTRARWSAASIRDTGVQPANEFNYAKKHATGDSSSGDSILKKLLMSDAGDFGSSVQGSRFFDVDLDTSAVLRLKQEKGAHGILANSEVELDLNKANGKKLSIVEVDVCVDGEDKKMLILGSVPY